MISQHTVKAFDADLRELTELICAMSALAATQIRCAIDALAEGDLALAREAVVQDAAVDAMQRDIEEKTVVTIARRQPMAVDLRHVVGVLRIANDLERVGDLAKNIAKRAGALERKVTLVRPIASIKRMTTLLLEQLSLAIAAFSARDRLKAVEARNKDAKIDVLFKAVVRNLLEYMEEDPNGITIGIHLLFCAKNIEKMGDHVSSIAETAHYVIEGRPLDEVPAAAAGPTASRRRSGKRESVT